MMKCESKLSTAKQIREGNEHLDFTNHGTVSMPRTSCLRMAGKGRQVVVGGLTLQVYRRVDST